MRPDPFVLQALPGRKAGVVRLVVSLTAALASLAATAQQLDWRLSGFGTAGWARSDQSYAFERFVTERGTAKRDSVLGAQVDVRITPSWSATAQLTVAPSLDSDHGVRLTPSWAFVSWRPDNDWLLRLGKQRLPLFLHTENRDVGQTYDLLRLPIEVYGIAPSTDMTGLSVSRTWQQQAAEWTLDTYAGAEDLSVRTYTRDLGPQFIQVRTAVVGASLTLHLEDASTFRASLYRAETRRRDGQPLDARYPRVDTPFGSYYKVSDQLPGPDVERTPEIVNHVITLGADVPLPSGWRVMSEVARTLQSRTELGADTLGAYVALMRRFDRVTPYVLAARMKSMGVSWRNALALDASADAAFSPDLALAQRAAGDSTPIYDQTSLGIGLSYALTPQSKLKGEWMQTRIGRRSAMVDSPTGGPLVSHELINTLSISCSFVF